MTPNEVRRAVARRLGIGVEALDAEARVKTRLIVRARRVLALVLLKTGRSLTEAGREMGRDHTTVMHARNTASAEDRAMADRIWKELVEP